MPAARKSSSRRARKSVSKPAPATFTMRLDSDAVAALDALGDSDSFPPNASGVFPYNARTRAARIRYLITHFGALHRRASEVESELKTAQADLDSLRAFQTALREFIAGD